MLEAGTEWRRSGAHLESVHLPAADVVVHRATKDVHGIRDDGCSVEEPPAGQLGEEMGKGEQINTTSSSLLWEKSPGDER